MKETKHEGVVGSSNSHKKSQLSLQGESGLFYFRYSFYRKKGKRQGMPQSQAAALPRHQGNFRVKRELIHFQERGSQLSNLFYLPSEKKVYIKRKQFAPTGTKQTERQYFFSLDKNGRKYTHCIKSPLCRQSRP